MKAWTRLSLQHRMWIVLGLLCAIAATSRYWTPLLTEWMRGALFGAWAGYMLCEMRHQNRQVAQARKAAEEAGEQLQRKLESLAPPP